METNSQHQPDWDKVIAILQQEQQGSNTDNLSEQEQVLLAELSEIKAASENYSLLPQFRTDQKWEELKGHILPISRTVKLWPRVAVAVAAVLAVVTFGLWLYTARYAPQIQSNKDVLADATKIAPGSNGATLTLASGKTIVLSEAKTGVVVGANLQYDDGSALSGASDISPVNGKRSMVATTTKGKTYAITLPDGTKVWLNAASSISFPSSFAGLKSRQVEISGEAYLEVAKDKLHPFIVNSASQRLEVLGTHFNINAYPDEVDVKTTLVEGSVRVSSSVKQSSLVVVLKPNEQAILSKIVGDTENSAGKIRVVEVDPTEATAWKNGQFKFTNQPLADIMMQISRWYDLDIVYEGELGTETFSGVIDRKANLSRILRILKKGGVEFRISGKTLIVIP